MLYHVFACYLEAFVASKTMNHHRWLFKFFFARKAIYDKLASNLRFICKNVNWSMAENKGLESSVRSNISEIKDGQLSSLFQVLSILLTRLISDEPICR